MAAGTGWSSRRGVIFVLSDAGTGEGGPLSPIEDLREQFGEAKVYRV